MDKTFEKSCIEVINLIRFKLYSVSKQVVIKTFQIKLP